MTDVHLQIPGAPASCVSDIGSESCSVNGTVPGLLGSSVFVSGAMTATAQYGSLSLVSTVASSGGEGVHGGLMGGYVWRAGAGFTDTLTVSGYSGAGFIQYEVDEGCCFGIFNAGFTQPLTLNGQDLFGIGLSPTFAFTSGVPFNLSMNFEGRSVGDEGDGIGPGSFSVSIDKIELFDVNMQAISNYSLIAASGTEYPAIGASPSIPEPNSIYLLATVILGLVCVCRKFSARRAMATP